MEHIILESTCVIPTVVKEVDSIFKSAWLCILVKLLKNLIGGLSTVAVQCLQSWDFLRTEVLRPYFDRVTIDDDVEFLTTWTRAFMLWCFLTRVSWFYDATSFVGTVVNRRTNVVKVSVLRFVFDDGWGHLSVLIDFHVRESLTPYYPRRKTVWFVISMFRQCLSVRNAFSINDGKCKCMMLSIFPSRPVFPGLVLMYLVRQTMSLRTFVSTCDIPIGVIWVFEINSIFQGTLFDFLVNLLEYFIGGLWTIAVQCL